jgi:hypothetical protein
MQRTIVVLALALVTGLGVGVGGAVQRSRTHNAALRIQADMEQRAIAAVQQGGLHGHLVGPPTAAQTKQLTLREANAYLGHDAYDVPPDTVVWLTVLQGTAVWGQAPIPGEASGRQVSYPNMWVLLGSNGEVLGAGSHTPGHELDLTQPPRPRPTPELFDESTKEHWSGQPLASPSPPVGVPQP